MASAVAQREQIGPSPLMSPEVDSLGNDRDLVSAVGPPPSGIDDPDRRFGLLVLLVTVVGGAWRVGYLVATKWSRHLMLNDSLYYSSQAWQNAHGHWFRSVLGDHPGAEHAPLTSLLLAPSSLLPHHEFWQRATNTIVGVAVIPLLALLGRRIGGRRVGVLAAVIAAVYPNLWMNDSLDRKSVV